jgi:DNA-binding transcriptional regulator YiaG
MRFLHQPVFSRIDRGKNREISIYHALMIDFFPKGHTKSTFMFIFAADLQKMKTNRIMDEIRGTISPEMKMQMELSVAIANRIYEILEEKGMSQKDFARLMGKTETEISRWLSGTHNLTLATLCKISIALGENLLEVPVNHSELVEA